MTPGRKRIAMVAALAVALGVVLAVRLMPARAERTSATAGPIAATDASASTSRATRPAGADAPGGAETASAAAARTAPDCLTPEALEQTVAIQREISRMRSVTALGAYMEAYRGIEEAGLRDLVAQGDTAAMVVLGRRLHLQAVGLDPADAVTTLNPDSRPKATTLEEAQRFTSLFRWKGVDTEEGRALAEAARDWYYRAAINGRLFALGLVGDIDYLLGRGPIEQGWISMEDAEALPEIVRRNMFPSRIYNAAVWYIAPELNSGLTSIYYKMSPEPKAVQIMAAALAARFERDREAAGLPRLTFEASEFEDDKAIVSRVCEAYREAWLAGED